MARFLIDEDMPRPTAARLRHHGFDADDVRDVGLRAHADQDVFAYALKQHATIITRDLDFANTVRFPLGSHHGIIVLRIANEVPAVQVVEIVLRNISSLTQHDISGLLIIMDLDRMRFRYPCQPGDQADY